MNPGDAMLAEHAEPDFEPNSSHSGGGSYTSYRRRPIVVRDPKTGATRLVGGGGAPPSGRRPPTASSSPAPYPPAPPGGPAPGGYRYRGFEDGGYDRPEEGHYDDDGRAPIMKIVSGYRGRQIVVRDPSRRTDPAPHPHPAHAHVPPHPHPHAPPPPPPHAVHHHPHHPGHPPHHPGPPPPPHPHHVAHPHHPHHASLGVRAAGVRKAQYYDRRGGTRASPYSDDYEDRERYDRDDDEDEDRMYHRDRDNDFDRDVDQRMHVEHDARLDHHRGRREYYHGAGNGRSDGAPHDPEDDLTGRVVYVDNLSDDVTTTGLADLFGMVGAVKELRLLYDRQGKPNGSADIVFQRRADAEEAIRSLHNVPLNNRPMRLSMGNSL